MDRDHCDRDFLFMTEAFSASQGHAMNLEDVAKLAGVSRSTVSRVVNDDARVSPDVRARVLAVIAETNYHPNAAARSLASRRTRILGLLIPQAMGDVFGDQWFPVMIQGCMDGCHEADYSLMLLMESSTDPETVTRIIERTLRSRHLDGIVISSSLNDEILGMRLRDEGFPYITIGRDVATSQNFIDVDNREAARTATEHLIGHGYRRLGMIAGPDSMVASEDRRLGFLDAATAAGIDSDEIEIRHGDYNEYKAFIAATDLLSSQPRPDAIFAASDAMARGVIRAAQTMNLRVPHDVAVIGFDGIQQDLIESHGLSTVRQPAKEIGRRAVELLVGMVNRSTTAPVQEWVPTELILRTSCGCLFPAAGSASDGNPIVAGSLNGHSSNHIAAPRSLIETGASTPTSPSPGRAVDVPRRIPTIQASGPPESEVRRAQRATACPT
jgi:LacI family transcriptional regulator